MRILIATAPLMYRQTLSRVLQRHRPQDEVLIAAPDNLEQEASLFHPHLIVCDDNASEVREVHVPSWVVIRFHDSMDATVAINGQASKLVHDIGMEDLFGVIDETERLGLRGS